MEPVQVVAQLSADLLAAEERAASTMRMGTPIPLPRFETPIERVRVLLCCAQMRHSRSATLNLSSRSSRLLADRTKH